MAKGSVEDRLIGLADVEPETDVDGQPEVQVVLRRDRRDSSYAINDRLTLVLEILKQAGAEILSMETKEFNLERLFLELTGRRLRD